MAELEGLIVNKFYTFLLNIWKEMNRPMTDQEFRHQRIMAGAKFCPHCDKQINELSHCGGPL